MGSHHCWCDSPLVSLYRSRAWWHLLLNAPSAPWWGYSNHFLWDPLTPTTCLYYYFLYFTLSARLDYARHLTLGLFSYLHAYDQMICEVSLPPMWSLLLQFKWSPAAHRDTAGRVFLSQVAGKSYSWPQEGSNAAMLGVPLTEASFCSHLCMLTSMHYGLYRREETVPGTTQREGACDKGMPTTGQTRGRPCVSGPFKLLLKATLLLQCFISTSSLKSILGECRVPGW